MKKATFIILICLIFLSGEIFSKDLTIVYTANSNGKLKSCGCPDDPYGGLSERVTLIKQLRQNDEPFLLIDSGNMVDIFGDYNPKAADVMKLMNMMGYDAAGAGFNEIYKGIGSAEKLRDNAAFPILAAGVHKKGGGDVFKSYILKKIGSSRIAVVGLCEYKSLPQIGNPEFGGFEFTDSQSELVKIFKEINGKADFVVLLSQMTPDDNKALLKKYNTIDVIIEDYTNKKYEKPVVENGGIILSPGKYGRFVGMAKFQKNRGKLKLISHKFIPILDIAQDKDAKKLIDRSNN